MTDKPEIAERGAMEPFGSTHRLAVADVSYVGPHRRYNACLGCFEENATRIQEQDARYATLVETNERLRHFARGLVCTGGHHLGEPCVYQACVQARAALAREVTP